MFQRTGMTVFLWMALGGAAAAGPLDSSAQMAASCSGCHPLGRSVDTPVPRLLGRNPADLVVMMQAFRTGKLAGTVMDRIAKGYSDDEIAAIAAWFGAQKD